MNTKFLATKTWGEQYPKNNSTLNIPNGKIIEFQLEAKNDIKDVKSEVGFYSERNVEITGMKENLLQTDLKVEVTDVIPPDLYVEIRTDGDLRDAYIESPIDQQAFMCIINEQGIQVSKKEISIDKGNNLFQIENDISPGYYIIQIKNEDHCAVTRFVIN